MRRIVVYVPRTMHDDVVVVVEDGARLIDEAEFHPAERHLIIEYLDEALAKHLPREG